MAIQMEYQKTVSSKIEKIKNKCRQIGVDFVSVDIDEDYKKILELREQLKAFRNFIEEAKISKTLEDDLAIVKYIIKNNIERE
jgi:NH3-dependent NAD+ synthetase